MRTQQFGTVFTGVALVLTAGAAVLAAQSRGATPAVAAAPPRVDYLTFAQGAIPVSIGGAGAKLGATFEHAVRATDGDETPFVVVNGASADTDVEFVYQLPALTTFDRLAVPNVVETPSPTQTFARLIEVHGSADGPTGVYSRLASATLKTHGRRGEVTELPVVTKRAVRWVKLRLAGGIDVTRPKTALEFSEVIGNGTQESPTLVDHFHGLWQGRGVRLQLTQAGPVVTGCYDTNSDLSGTVTGNILKATGLNRTDGTKSAFILSVAENGDVRGVRSSNGAPFRLYSGPRALAGAAVICRDTPPPALGCGSIIHGITFAYDSADIRPESAPVLTALYAGLQTNRSGSIVIEGHTSNEGTNEYNQRLSERRAQSVVTDLTRRGFPATRLKGAGIGELRPIATNNDESGRSMNRRVEVKCQ